MCNNRLKRHKSLKRQGLKRHKRFKRHKSLKRLKRHKRLKLHKGLKRQPLDEIGHIHGRGYIHDSEGTLQFFLPALFMVVEEPLKYQYQPAQNILYNSGCSI
uniref:Uncharacterized protein n=1 Tax=Romanomermis culicivorax TaxID=13658 RepID=A0A915HPQ6_ROMCU